MKVIKAVYGCSCAAAHCILILGCPTWNYSIIETWWNLWFPIQRPWSKITQCNTSTDGQNQTKQFKKSITAASSHSCSDHDHTISLPLSLLRQKHTRNWLQWNFWKDTKCQKSSINDKHIRCLQCMVGVFPLCQEWTLSWSSSFSIFPAVLCRHVHN